MILDKNGKEVKITKLPPGPIDPDLCFDRWSHDQAGKSPDISRSTALAHKDFGSPIWADGRRSKPKRTE